MSRRVESDADAVTIMTIHKAKGLEFDHVAVLDGDWMRTGADEDANAPRRLYYVAMTRARKKLWLLEHVQRRVQPFA